MNNLNPNFDVDRTRVINDLKCIVDSLQLSILLIGAQSRILIFDKPYQIQGRATTDCDIVVKLDSWDKYEILIAKITEGEKPKFKISRIIHKFIHIETNLEVDIIPFGDICNQNQEIIWPDGNQMSILGLEEAFINSQIQRIDDIEIRVLTLESFIALKLLAWNERREYKDLSDIILVLENYQENERVFDELNDELIAGTVEFEEAAIVLLGRDICKTFKDKTLSKVNEIVILIIENQNRYLPQFVSRDTDSNAWDDAFIKIVRRFQALQYGLNNNHV